MPTAARHAAAPRASAYRGSATSDRAPTIGAPMGVLPTRADSLDELSPQELQIVQMVAQGLTNGVIAERLYLSRRTVESHLYRVFPNSA